MVEQNLILNILTFSHPVQCVEYSFQIEKAEGFYPIKVDAYPFPVKLKFASNKESLINIEDTIRELIDQVYKFSRMYWKSVTQVSVPVTILYPEMVAEKFPIF